LKIIRDNINEQSYKTWFEPIKAVELKDNVLTIEVPGHFYYEWLETHYIDLLKKAIKKELGNEGKLEYSILMDNSYDNDALKIKLPSTNVPPLTNPSISIPLNTGRSSTDKVPSPFVIPGIQKIKVDSHLKDNKTFDNFVEGSYNRLARNAGLAITKNPGKTSFNPFLLYSKTGLGKTHLVNAIGVEIKNNFPNKTVIYVDARRFYYQFVDACKNNNHNDFIHFYQSIDVLIIDDIHEFSGKGKMQDAFFEIFNHLHQLNKQIILTVDKPILELNGIQERILSRFKWGLSTELQTPDNETKIAIINKKTYEMGLTISQEVVEYIANNINTNIREIEGILISLLAQSVFNKKTISLELAKELIDKWIVRSSKEITLSYIQKVVCDYFKLSPEEVISSSRKREILQARQIIMYFTKQLTKMSLSSIGKRLGNRDHATVMHSCKAVSNLIETNKRFRSTIEEIKKNIII